MRAWWLFQFCLLCTAGNFGFWQGSFAAGAFVVAAGNSALTLLHMAREFFPRPWEERR